MDANDPLNRLLSQPLVELRERWRSPLQIERLAKARDIQARGGKDAYWEWASAQLRWMQPWSVLRVGEFPGFRYFVGGYINVCDNCVDRHAEDPARRDKAAIIWEGEPGEVVSLSYAELRERVARFANGLKSLGVKRGDVVAVYLPNLPEAFVAIHACNRIGAIYTVLFSGFSPEAVALRLQASRAKVLVTADGCWRRGRKVPLLENARTARPSAPSLQQIIVVDRCGSKPVLREGERGFDALIADESADCPWEPLEANDPAFLIFTSGTEARPKGLVHSVAGFLLGAWANVLWQIGIDDADTYWCAADIGWLTFPIQVVVGGLAHGASLLCYEGAFDAPTKDRFYQIVARHRVTKILSAPTALRMLRALGDEAAKVHDLSALKLITVQGEPLDPETFNWAVQTFDVPVVNAYGQTETGSTWTYPVYGAEPLKAGSCGTPVPGHDYEVLDDAGRRVPPGVKGNLVLTEPFPTLARTIWDDPDRYLASYFTRFPNRYQTSDEAIVDHDGHLWVLGRADDVINVAAHRISTMEIESIVCSQAGVADGAVVGVNDALKGTVPVAFITLRADAEAGAVKAQVDAAVVNAIGSIARLSRIYVCTALPKTRAGKTLRRLLREAAETGSIRGDTTGLEDAAALAAVLKAVAAST
ncbi:MAG: AMP-binding protein [Panacagrimonas sp.]